MKSPFYNEKYSTNVWNILDIFFLHNTYKNFIMMGRGAAKI